MSNITELVRQGDQFYCAGIETGAIISPANAERALPFFLQAIKQASLAPDDDQIQIALDHSDIGHAVWAAWVCLDLLERPGEEIEKLVKDARQKSPVTARRMEERMQEYRAKLEAQDRLEKALEVLCSPDGREPQALQQAEEYLIETGSWWAMRNSAKPLVKAGYGDLAWRLLNAALLVAMNKKDNLPSIYAAMGDVCKFEKRHHDAARQYLLACATSNVPSKRDADQVRISLKKAGLKDDAKRITDELLKLVGAVDMRTLIEKLDAYVEAARPKLA